jgi:hypothetical protein
MNCVGAAARADRTDLEARPAHTADHGCVANATCSVRYRYADPVDREEAEQALQAWASVERDELVRAAHEAGVPKHRIHTITGIARSTIDRILETPMNLTQAARLAEYLVGFTADWPRHEPFPYHYNAPPAMATVHTPESLAGQLFADAQFQALKLGTFLNTPDGQLLAEAVGMLTPLRYQQDIELLVAALQLAADRQHQAARDTVVKGVLVALGIGALAAAISGGTS